ncbi:MAG: hypothetical protein KDD64_09490, partial [Bdellovibrionales bacterium]|nr:hypothetical protein [Bdellovibrionales bacterium]
TSSREAETIAEALTKFISSTEGVSERIEAAHGVRLASQFIDDPSTRFGVLKKLLMSKEFQEIRLEKIGGFIFTDAVESLLFIDSQSERSEGLRMLDLIAPSYLPDFSQGERQVLSERLFEMKEAFPTGEIQKRLSRMALDIAPQESLIRSNIEEVLLSEAESMSYEDLKEIFDSGLGERDFRRSLKSLLVKSAA